jgi:hypothetical protein
VEDRSVEYSALARLFRLLVREENFDDATRQKLVVETLLRETYPNDSETREKAYIALCHALNVAVPARLLTGRAAAFPMRSPMQTHRRVGTSRVGAGGTPGGERAGSTDAAFSQQPGQRAHLDVPPTPIVIALVKDVFVKLLNEQPVVVVIEDAHEMDEGSWGVVLRLVETEADALLVLSHDSPEALKKKSAPVAEVIPTRRMSLRPNSSNAALWRVGAGRNALVLASRLFDGSFVRTSYEQTAVYMKDLHAKCQRFSHVKFNPIMVRDVKLRLSNALGMPTSTIDVGLAQEIVDLCAGKHFWFSEVMALILEQGWQEFLKDFRGDTSIARPDASRTLARGVSMRLVGSSLSKGIGALHRGVSGLATPRRVVPTPRTAEAGAAHNQGAAALALDMRASARQPSAKGANTARGSPGILASIYHRAASIMIPQTARKNPDVVSPDTKEKLTRAGSATGRPTGQYPAPNAESPHDREPDIGGESPSPSPRPKKKSFVENLRVSFVGPGSILDAARAATGQVSSIPL